MNVHANGAYEAELERQNAFLMKIKEENARAAASGNPRTAFCDTYGCQQNFSDTERIRGVLREMGYADADDANEADLVIINTCAVREHAEQRVFGNVGALSHAKRRNPGMIIAVCGCMAQRPEVAERIKHSFPYVDIVFGTHAIWKLPELLYGRLSGGKRAFDLTDELSGAIVEGMPAVRAEGPRAWMPIMYGCDNFCTYCIVPYVRGRERSRLPADVESEFRSLVDAGYKDIMLLGQNVNSYGKSLENADFPTLLRRLCAIEGDYIVRFMTSHPKDATEALFAAMAESPRAAHHLHLPFQSGSDRILASMNRHYTHEDYIKLITSARSYMPDITITSDIIVGFPGETEQDFEDTLTLVREVGFSSLFTFLYSKRPGTPAAAMDDATTDEEKHLRFDRLIALQNEMAEEQNKAFLGKTVRALVDGKGRESSYPLSARTGGNRLVHTRGDESFIGDFHDIKITDCSPWALFGEVEK